jgi:hypothetical protein
LARSKCGGTNGKGYRYTEILGVVNEPRHTEKELRSRGSPLTMRRLAGAACNQMNKGLADLEQGRGKQRKLEIKNVTVQV